MSLKKAWITAHATAELYVLSLESAQVEPVYMRLSVHDAIFPAKATLEHPQRHVIPIGLLTEYDLMEIRSAIETALKNAYSYMPAEAAILRLLRDSAAQVPELIDQMLARGYTEAAVKEATAKLLDSQEIYLSPSRVLSLDPETE